MAASQLVTYLNHHSIDDLKTEKFIKIYNDPLDSNFVGLVKTDDSPKDPITSCCGGAILDKTNKTLVISPSTKAVNVNDRGVPERFWANVSVGIDIIGTMIIVYYADGFWHAKTQWSFGFDKPDGYDGTWSELFWKSSGGLLGSLRHYANNAKLAFIFKLYIPTNDDGIKDFSNAKIILVDITITNENSVRRLRLNANAALLIVNIIRPKNFRNANGLFVKRKVCEYMQEQERENPNFSGVFISSRNSDFNLPAFVSKSSDIGVEEVFNV